ncbi:hypothetical protein FACS1894126_0140 [Alphaproteobacteria bacterium]|nr:hypothetical protein FACS1894126_0140 [Alphaproteobacteria bacterium]
MQQNKIGIAKFLIYAKIGMHVLWKYRKHLSIKFITAAVRLLAAFSDNKVVKLANGTYKLHIYLPAYPTRAFFKAIEDKLISKPPKPVTVVLSVTKACPYRCKHCYQRFDKNEDMSSEKVLETVKKFSEAGVSFLNIEGGDAFLKFNLLCKIMDSLDDSMEVWINTTGTNITKKKLATLKEKGVCGIMVSVHGSSAEFHDDFVGVKGAFELARKALVLCKEVGLGSAINTVLTYEQIQGNVLDEIMLLAKDCNCDFVQLIHPKRAGEWLKNKTLNEKDAEIRRYVSKAHKHYNALQDFSALPAQAQEEHEDKFGCTCGGIDRFYVGANGEVQPCEFLNISFGNVNEEPFEIIFARMREAFKVPCIEWMCEVKASEIYEFMQKHSIEKTPIPYEYTKELVKNWSQRDVGSSIPRAYFGIYQRDAGPGDFL